MADVDVIEDWTVDVELDVLRIERIVKFAIGHAEASDSWTITIVLTDDTRLRELHRDFLGIDDVTDVMTFPFDPIDRVKGGEIVVSVERAAEQGPALGMPPDREVEFLVVHGLLHLMGWDDGTSKDRAAMLARQSELLADFENQD